MQSLTTTLMLAFCKQHLLLCIKSLAFFGKIYLLFYLFSKKLLKKKTPPPIIFLVGVLIGEAVVDLAWIARLTYSSVLIHLCPRPAAFFIRISWAFELIKFQSLGLFIESLGERKYKFKPHQKILLGINACLSSYFILASIARLNSISVVSDLFHSHVISLSVLYTFLAIILPSLYLILRRLNKAHLPKILNKQILILLKFLITPYFIAQLAEILFFYTDTHSYIATCISTPLLTFAIFYSLKKVMGLRFLNLNEHVATTSAFQPIKNFKEILEQLSHATNLKELGHITQSFFKEEFRVQPTRLYFKIRNHSQEFWEYPIKNVDMIVEKFTSQGEEFSKSTEEFIKKQKIFITDEIAFSQFYNEDLHGKQALQFLQHINADIFLPMYEHDQLTAYIIVERDARAEFFSSSERDQMIIFASYLSNTINLLQNRDLESIILREKELHEELYLKHQEINQYKESIRSFLRDARPHTIGILFYKNRRFIFGNQAAQQIIAINPNQQEGHPLTKLLRKVALQAETYKTEQVVTSKNTTGEKIIISALPNLEQNNVIITINYPEIADIIKQQVDLLKNPSDWDYLLYLETTKSGQIINQLIPGSGSVLLNFKIELLKCALSNKAVLLELPEKDLAITVDILHHISMRQTLDVIDISGTEKRQETGIKLFGTNSLLDTEEDSPPALLERLNNVGTLLIKNVHFMHSSTQEALAEFIKYGYYRPIKSDKKRVANVRIICFTTQNLPLLVKECQFSEALFEQLKQTTLRMPSLYTLSKEEMENLIQETSEQAIVSPLFKNLLELSTTDRSKLITSPPASLHEFKSRVQQALTQKTKKADLPIGALFDPAFNVTDPELIEAVRLGKGALKDDRVMTSLWNKFKNQNKIATLLGVNRSSVNRRCKKLNLE